MENPVLVTGFFFAIWPRVDAVRWMRAGSPRSRVGDHIMSRLGYLILEYGILAVGLLGWTLVDYGLVCGTASPALAQTKPQPIISGPSEISWQSGPAMLPRGVQIALLYGDPSKPGHFVIRLKMPANYQVPPHHHPAVENVTVLQGSFHAGMGDKLDKSASEGFDPGGFISMPANMNHYAWTPTISVIQIESEGPFEITYADPAEDPRKN